MRTAVVLMSIVAMSVLVAANCGATEVYWSPAHELAPQGMSAPMAAGDLDGDGDYDVSMLMLIWHFWNVGTPQVPEWEMAEPPYDGVVGCELRSGALGDLDHDGDLDLVTTCLDEHLRFHRNVGTPQDPEWQYEPSMFDSVDIVAGGAEPYLVDLDADEDLDMLVVCNDAQILRHIENTGTPTSPEWCYHGTVLVVGPGSPASIALGDVDGDSDPDLVSITVDSPPQCWENVGTPEVFEFVKNPSMLVGVEEPQWGCAIELFDADADGDLDLLIGHYLGENFLYLNEGVTPVRTTSWGRIKALYR